MTPYRAIAVTLATVKPDPEAPEPQIIQWLVDIEALAELFSRFDPSGFNRTEFYDTCGVPKA
jgi:hypothetical protein